jgi:hypothetical protein
MADARSIECANETCEVVFETTNSRKRFHSDKCRLEQWERENHVELRRVRVRRKPSGPSKPRTNWKKKYLAAEEEIARLRAQLAERTKGRKKR